MINERVGGDAGAEESVNPPETPEVQEVERQGFSLAKALRSPRTLISFALAIAIVVFAVRGFDIDVQQTWQYMRGANGWLLLAGLASSI